MLAGAVGFGIVNDLFTVANTPPNSIFELLPRCADQRRGAGAGRAQKSTATAARRPRSS